MPINAIFGETVRTISNTTVSTENTGVFKTFLKSFFFFLLEKKLFHLDYYKTTEKIRYVS